jgi:hypothetical protein
MSKGCVGVNTRIDYHQLAAADWVNGLSAPRRMVHCRFASCSASNDVNFISPVGEPRLVHSQEPSDIRVFNSYDFPMDLYPKSSLWLEAVGKSWPPMTEES